MRVDPEDRFIRNAEPKGWGGFFLRGGVALLLVTGVAIFVGVNTFPQKMPPFIMAFFKEPESEFPNVYASLHVPALPAALENMPDVHSGLARLRQERCDKSAIYDATEALVKEKQLHIAAQMLEGFAAGCANGDGDLRRAADLYYQLGDNEKAFSLTTKLVQQYPDDQSYWYIHAKVQAALHMYGNALTSYANTIQLSGSPAQIGQWVFTEMAEVYGALHRYCDAIDPIQDWVALDPDSRSTRQTEAIIANYRQLGQCKPNATGGETFRGSDRTIHIRATINGVPGTFLIDTGASFVTVDETFAKKAGLAFEEGKATTSQTANGTVKARYALARTVQAGRAHADHVTIVVLPRALGAGLDGLLGMSFLSRFNIALRPGAVQISARAETTAADIH